MYGRIIPTGVHLKRGKSGADKFVPLQDIM